MFAGNVDRPELGLDAPVSEPGDVGLAGVESFREIELREPKVALGTKPPREVIMAVEEHPCGVDLSRPFRDGRQGTARLVRPGESPLPRAPCQKGGQRTLDKSSLADPPNRGPIHSHGRSFPEIAGARGIERLICLLLLALAWLDRIRVHL